VKKAVPQSRRFNNNFRGPMGGPRGYGTGMPRQMPVHNAGPWYGAWNQMAATNMYGYQGGQPSSAGGWGDWNSTGYFPQSGQQGSGGYAGYNNAGSYDYSQNGSSTGRGQSQNGSVPQRPGGYQSQY